MPLIRAAFARTEVAESQRHARRCLPMRGRMALSEVLLAELRDMYSAENREVFYVDHPVLGLIYCVD
jgi:hypothetical protein